MQIFHKNNAKIVRAQTVIKAYEGHALRSPDGAPLFVRTMAAPSEYRPTGYIQPTGARTVRRVKSGKRMVRRIKF